MMFRDTNVSRSAIGAAVAMLVSGGAAVAADNGTDTGASLQEVVVTAQRRVEDVQKTPIAISTVSAEDINSHGLVQMDEVLKNVPAVVVQGAARGFQVSIRGIGTNLPPGVGESSVSTNYDGVYSARAEAGLTGFYDLQRVEVLRGPQGTLYGRNATAGVVNVISNDPQLGKFAGYGTLELGNYDLLRAEAAANFAVSDNSAVRAAFATINRNGYMSNGNDDNVASSGRLKYLYKPSSDLSLLLGAEFIKVGGQGPGGTPRQFVPDNPYYTTDPGGSSQNYHKWKLWAQLDWNVGFGVVTFLPAYQDGTGKVYGSFGGNPTNGYDPKSIVEKSAELRLANEPDSRVIWVTGLYHYDMAQETAPISGQCAANGELITAPPGYNIPLPPGSCAPTFVAYVPGTSGDPTTVKVNSDAVFGQITWPFTDSLRGIAGLRATRDTKKLIEVDIAGTLASTPGNATPLIPGVTVSPFSRTWNSLDWKVGIEKDLGASSMLYGIIATGHRPGGFNQATVVLDNARSYDQEKMTDFEAGIKNRFFDNRLQVNGDVFYYDYKNLQLNDSGITNLSPPPAFVSTYFNVPRSRLFGAELETEAQVTRADRISSTLAYLNSRLQSSVLVHPSGLPAGTCPVLAGSPNQACQLEGNPFPRAPQFTFNLTYEHAFDLPNGATLTPSGTARYSSSYYVTSQEQDLLGQTQPAYWTGDLSLHYAAASDRWSATAYLKNVNDQVIRQSWFVQYVQIAPPRTYGIVVSAKF